MEASIESSEGIVSDENAPLYSLEEALSEIDELNSEIDELEDEIDDLKSQRDSAILATKGLQEQLRIVQKQLQNALVKNSEVVQLSTSAKQLSPSSKTVPLVSSVDESATIAVMRSDMAKLESGWREKCSNERLLRMSYERLLINSGISPSRIAANLVLSSRPPSLGYLDPPLGSVLPETVARGMYHPVDINDLVLPETLSTETTPPSGRLFLIRQLRIKHTN
jgi:hypothetical protein